MTLKIISDKIGVINIKERRGMDMEQNGLPTLKL